MIALDLVAPLRSHAVGILQCDTILGLVGIANATVATRIRRIKQRPDDRPFIVLISSIEMVTQVSSVELSFIAPVCDVFWPGPLTLVLPKSKWVPDEITGGKPTIAVRLPHFWPLNELLTQLNEPLISTSVNVSGEPDIHHVSQVPSDIRSQVDFCVADRAPMGASVASTVLDCTQMPFRVLREGAVSTELIRSKIGNVE